MKKIKIHVCFSSTLCSDGDGWVIIWSMRTKRPLLKWKAHKDNCLKVTTVKNNQLIR